MSDLITMMAAVAGQQGGAEYQISRSLRFNSADSAYLSRTPAGAGNRKTWTWSGWVKRSALGAGNAIIEAGTSPGTTLFSIIFLSDDAIRFQDFDASVQKYRLITTQVFRDVSSWYHLVFVLDTSNATSGDRVKMYVNGQRVTSFSTEAYPTQDYEGQLNRSVITTIGKRSYTDADYANYYLTEVHFIDGQALTPASFGEVNATTGVWSPIAYTGTYGTNGFHLDFADNSSTTALGYDAAGSNDWTPNNFSVTAGAGNDSLVDTPTPYGTDTGAGGEVRGNYCTLNPLAHPLTSSYPTYSNGNLSCVTSETGYGWAFGTIEIPTSGKWYWEFTPTSGGNQSFSGITKLSDVTDFVAYYGNSGEKSIDNVNSSYGATYGNNNVIGVAVDVDSSTVTFYKDGVSQGAISYTTSGGGYFPSLADGTGGASVTFNINFGQQPFVHAAPSGHKALCTQNIEAGTITTSGTFTGNGSTDGPFVYLNGVPTAMTIDGNAVTFGTHADKLANGFKVRSSSASYNANATSMSYTISTTGAKFKYANAQPNP